jgi:Protein of unknown function (DUF2490)
MKNILLIISFFSLSFNSIAQNTRLNHQNTIGWYNFFGTYKLNTKLGLHTEYQWRRNNVITDWQQSLLRVGLNYSINPRVLFRVGYAWVETFPYGAYSINSMNKDFTEHRIFQMLQLAHKESRFEFSHRFMLEQRFVGSYSKAELENEDVYKLLHRMRYLFRVQMPLRGTEIIDKTPYIACYNEVFIGFGKNVNANVFDQNRIGVLLGYRLNNTFRLEGGYLNQIVQFGRLINSQNVYQYNNGLIINALINVN